MSVVAAKVYDNNIEISADSIAVRGYLKCTTNINKIAPINGMIIGGVGTAEEISLMFRYASTHKPEQATESGVLAFITEFSKWKGDYGDHCVNNHYLLVYGCKLFYIESMLVTEINDYWAIGAGEDFATAALYLGHSAKEAVKVSCELCCYVAEPIKTFEMDRDGAVHQVVQHD